MIVAIALSSLTFSGEPNRWSVRRASGRTSRRRADDALSLDRGLGQQTLITMKEQSRVDLISDESPGRA
jgi:hypothetical protein